MTKLESAGQVTRKRRHVAQDNVKNQTKQSLDNTKEPSRQKIKSIITNQRQEQVQLTDYVGIKVNNFAVGDSIHSYDEQHTRLYFQNVNGLGSDGNKWSHIVRILNERNASIIGLAETNIHWTRRNTASLKHSLKNVAPHSLAVTSCSNIHLGSGVYQPGGTLLAVLNEWTARTTASGSDPTGMGRWSQTTFLGKENTSLTIIIAYRVVAQSGISGPTTAWTQQFIHLSQSGKRMADPRQQILQDLSGVIQSARDKGSGVIIMMDANEAYLTQRQQPTKLAEWAQQNDLSDVHYRLHPDDHGTASYIRGTSQIDFIFATADVLPYICRAGFLAFNELVDSDHRGLFLDLDLAQYLRGFPSTSESAATRRLHSTNPRAVWKYQTKLIELLDRNAVFQRVQQLSHFDVEINSKWWHRVNQLDEDVSSAMQKAEESLPSNQYPFSPQLIQAQLRCIFWRTALTAVKTKRDMSGRLEYWASLITSNKPSLQSTYSLPLVSKEFRTAKAQLRQVRRDAKTLRREFLELRAQAEELAGNGKMVTILNNLIRREETRAAHAVISSELRATSRSGLNHLLIPNGMQPEEYPYDPATVSNWDIIQDDEAMQQYLRARNIQHFGQAKGTPFTIEPLCDKIDFQASSPEVDQILEGRTPPSLEFIQGATRSFLQACSRKTTEVPIQITRATLESTYRHWRESTGTYGGRHLGHYRALLAPTGQDEDDQLPTKAQRILSLHTTMINLALQAGKPLNRWCRALNIVLPKIPGKPFLHKLRIIHLFDAEYQLVLKEVTNQINVHAEQSGLLGERQYGSRIGRSSERLLFSTSLTMDVIRSTRMNAGMANQDAQACYDRMVPSAVGLVDRAFGWPAKIVQMHGTALETMEYKIKTVGGISDESIYSSSTANPLYGNGQGACDSPSQWGLTSVILSDVHSKSAHGCLLQDPCRQVTLRKTIQMFVDDSDIFANGISKDVAALELLERIRHDSQVWADLLHVSGGKLELTKCFFTAVIWKFDTYGYPIPMKVADMGDPVTRLTQGAEQAELKIHESTSGYKTLGQYHSFVGTPQEERVRLATKVGQVVRKLWNTGLTRKQAAMGYQSVFLPSLLYGIGTCPLSARDLYEVQAPATAAFLTAMGFNRHMPRDLVYGPKAFGGLGFNDLPTEAGVAATVLALTHLRETDSLEGSLLRVALRNRQLEAGVRQPLLEDTSQSLPYLVPGWVPRLREFLGSIDHSIIIPTEKAGSLHRENDSFLMDEILQHFTHPMTLKRINACRLYLRITRISELATTDGTMIDISILDEPDKRRKSTLEWPQQDRPAKTNWNLFKYAIFKSYGWPGRNRDHRLRKPLGEWVVPVQGLEQQWQEAIDLSAKILYRWVCGQWHLHRQISNPKSSRLRSETQRWCFEARSMSTTSELPNLCVPIVTKFVTNHFEAATPGGLKMQVANRTATTFSEHLTQMNCLSRSHNQVITFGATDTELEQVFRDDSELVHCSDGGVKHGQGSYGWILALLPSQRILAYSSGPAYGDIDMMHSFRAEAYGGISAAQFITQALTYFEIEPPDREFHWTWVCDNLGLIQRITRLQDSFPSIGLQLQTDADVCQQLSCLLKEIPHRSIRHVHGHQEGKADLSFDEWLNIQADGYATDFYRRHIEPQVKKGNPRSLENVPLTSGCGAQLVSHHDRRFPRFITTKVKHHLRSAALTPDLRAYLVKKFRWTADTPDIVNWLAYSKAQTSITLTQFVTTVKLATGWAATAQTLHRQNPDEVKHCLSCWEDEDSDHVLQCTSRMKEKVAYLVDLRAIWKKHRVLESIQGSIMAGLRVALNMRPEPEDAKAAQCAEAFRRQVEIGWIRFVYGYTVVDWMHEQESHDNTLPPRKHQARPEQWVIEMIRAGWQFVQTVWHCRNNVKHGMQPTQQERMRQSLEAQIDSAYERSGLLTSNTRQRYFPQDVAALKNGGIPQIQAWLKCVNKLIAIETQYANERQREGMKKLSWYFGAAREGIG